MIITSLNGKRSMSIARTTRDRVIHHLLNNPRKTVIEYANETLVAETAINLIIGRCLLDKAAAGDIAVSRHGRKPEWYYHVADRSVIPQRMPLTKRTKPALLGVTDKQLRLDYHGLTTQYNIATIHRMSPAKRQRAQQEFADRVAHVAGAHQDTIHRTDAEILRLKDEMRGLREAVQLLATVMTNTTVKTAA